MKKTNNSVNVEGYLFSHSIEEKVTGPNSKAPGTTYLSGEVNVAVDEEGMNVIPVHFSYVVPKTKAGKTNRTYGMLEKIMTGELCNWVDDGKINAAKIQIQTAIALNEFYIKNDEGEDTLVSAKRLEGGFINEIKGALTEPESRNKFDVDMLINGVKEHEENEDKGTPRYVEVKGAVFNFRGDLMPVTFTVENENGMDYFLSNYENETAFTRVWGHINSIIVKQEIKEESAFGEPMVKIIERKRKSWTIAGAKVEPYDFGDAEVMTQDELKEKLKARNVYLATLKKNYEDYQAQKNAPATSVATPASTGVFTF